VHEFSLIWSSAIGKLPHNRSFQTGVAFMCFLSLLGCDPIVQGPPGDVVDEVDTGVDAGSLSDAGVIDDGGVVHDAGVQDDAGFPDDAGFLDDAGVIDVPIVVPGSAAELDTEPLGTGPVALPLGLDRVVRGGGADGFEVVGANGEILARGAGTPRAARVIEGALTSALGEGGALIATETALLALSTTGGTSVLAPSPLGARTGPVVDLMEVGDTLWIAAAGGLYRYDATRFEEVRPGGVPLAAAQLAGPLSIDGTQLVVAASDRGVFAVGGDATLRAFDLGVASPVAVDVDARGTLWVVAAGRLLERSAAGDWLQWLFAEDVGSVTAGRRATDVWLSVGADLVHVEGGVFSVAGPAPTTFLAADDGAALVVRADGVVERLREGRSVRLEAPREAEVLETVRLVDARALPRSLQAELALVLDGVSIPAGAPLSLDPTQLSPGLHRLVATATYPDGDVLRAERQFFALTADFPTWTDDVLPVAEGVCSACHTPTGGAHPLENSDQWRAEIDRIVEALDSGEMPLGEPLSEEDRLRIRLWAATGMQE
jgi:hypothetical protein